MKFVRIGLEELIIGIYFFSVYKSYVVSWAQCTPCKASVLVSFLLTLTEWTYDFGAAGTPLYQCQCAMQGSMVEF